MKVLYSWGDTYTFHRYKFLTYYSSELALRNIKYNDQVRPTKLLVLLCVLQDMSSYENLQVIITE